jgi:hypothetical protein
MLFFRIRINWYLATVQSQLEFYTGNTELADTLTKGPFLVAPDAKQRQSLTLHCCFYDSVHRFVTPWRYHRHPFRRTAPRPADNAGSHSGTGALWPGLWSPYHFATDRSSTHWNWFLGGPPTIVLHLRQRLFCQSLWVSD